MARHRTAARYSLPSGPAPIAQLPDLDKTNAANARLAQFPLENEAKQAQLARAQSAEARSRYQLQKEIETDRQKVAFYNGLQELEQNLNARNIPIGTKEHAEAFAAYAHAFPLARSSADVNQTLKVHALVNDDQAALKDRMRALSPAPEKAALRYDRLQGDIANYEALLKGDISRQATANKGTPNVPYNPAFDVDSSKIAGGLEASKLEAARLLKSYPQLAPTVQPQAKEQPVQSTVSPTPPALATDAPTVPSTTPTSQAVETPQPTGTPKHLGRYNPKTGEFE